MTQLLVRLHHVVLVQHSWAVAVVAAGLPLDLVEAAIVLQSPLRVTILQRWCTAASTSCSEATFIRREVHLLFLWTAL